MVTPTIHLNGSSPAQLVGALKSARSALIKAQDALAATAPHARDYYPQGDGAFYEARDEHASRVQRLEAVSQELLEIALAVMNQK
jgi:hypothetical protein